MKDDNNHTRPRYDRIASFYDVLNPPDDWRRRLWKGPLQGKILEIGVGTGKNIPFYPPGASVVAIDSSERMLEKAAKRKALRQDVHIELHKMDVTTLLFDDRTFDVVVGSYVLMVLDDPPKALREIRRVLRPSGQLLLLEFTRSETKYKLALQKLLTPFTRAVYHASLTRNITGLIEANGFKIYEIEEVADDIVKILKAN